MVADTDLTRPPRPTQLNIVKGDVDKALEYRTELAELLAPICELFTKAKREDKIDLSFQISPDALGKFFVGDLKVLKNLL